MINALRSCLLIEEIGTLMTLVNGDTDDESDDIISEAVFYDYFVTIINQLENINPKQISRLIEKELKDYDETASHKLKLALEIMVNSYLVSNLKEKVDNAMKEIRK